MDDKPKIAILGGGEEELSLLSEFHRNPQYKIIAIYDRDPRAVALEIAEIINVPTYSDNSFLEAFRAADYIIVTGRRSQFQREIELLQRDRKRIINPSEAASYLACERETGGKHIQPPWPVHLEEALQYINRITDRERLLKWLLEISVRAVDASSGSIMLYSGSTRELYIGYATGLSQERVKKTRQKLGEGVAGKVAAKKQAILIKEIIDTPLYRGGRERNEIQSAISAPLVHEGVLVGVLNVSTNRNEKQLLEKDVEVIKLLASKISPIMQQHLKINAQEIREIEYQIRSYIESLFHKEIGFHEKFTLLSIFLAEKLAADNVTVYTATDEGDWLILGGSDQQLVAGIDSPRIHCIKGSIARAYLEREEILMTEARHDAGLKIKAENGSITSIYIPLVHNEPLGVLVIEFSSLEAFERFLRMKDTLRFQVGFFVFSQLREIRQTRRMERLEKLSDLTPALMGSNGLAKKIKMLPAKLSSLIGASMSSIHYINAKRREAAYDGFPGKDSERKKRVEHDNEVLDHVLTKWEPTCLSILPADVEMYEKPPMYRSVIAYPIYRSADVRLVYIGYDKVPETPLDSRIFGEHEISILKKVSELLEPILEKGSAEKGNEVPVTFDDLLRSNQKILLEHIKDEIDRAERYHHGFTFSLFKVNGLERYLKTDYQKGLKLINELSLGIRKRVRKTDYFSWIEPDAFGVLSLESYQRMTYLEERLLQYVTGTLTKQGLYDPVTFYPASSYSLYPGPAETPAAIITVAKTKL